MHTVPSPLRRRLMLAAFASCLPSCRKDERPAAIPASPESKWFLTPGAPPPDWSRLDRWQECITASDFSRLLETVVSDGASWFRSIEIRDHAALIRTSSVREGDDYVLKFAAPGTTPASGPRYWRKPSELPPLSDANRPLEGLHIALDPGHIGGAWAQMEERWYQFEGFTVREGDSTLRTARILGPMLEAMGARVSFLRTGPEPAGKVRPEDLLDAARASLAQEGGKPVTEFTVRKEAERLFYRTAEIRARGDLVNTRLRPDLVLCLHYNGIGSADPAHAQMKAANHLHVLAHGCLDLEDFRHDDQRLDAVLRAVQGIPDTELPLCIAVARTMADATGLPPYSYPGRNARMVPGQPYVWTRNLIANRIYQCPVVYLEPWVADNREVFERLRAGDYEGTATVAGRERISIFREYAGGVAAGLKEFFSAERRS